MQIFKFEFKKQLPSVLIWTLVIFALQWLLVEGFYPVFLDSKVTMQELINGFPPEFLKAFGFNLDDIFSFPSYTSMTFLYLSIFASIMSVTNTLSIFAREKQNKCQDFLFSKPLKRTKVFIQKLGVSLVSLVILNIPYLILFYYSVSKYVGEINYSLIQNSLGLFFTQLWFMSLAIFLATYLRRIRSSSGMGTSVGLFAFLLSAVYSLTEKDIFKYFAPLNYFSPNAIVMNGHYDLGSVLMASITFIVLMGLSYYKFIRNDIKD